MTRQPDWRVRLASYLAAVAAKPFAPGEHDCALFAAGAVTAMTGVDLAADWRGAYASLPAGLRALRKAGFDDHIALVARQFKPIHPAFAQVGDIAVLEGDDGFAALGIVQGERIYVLRPDGIATLPLTDAKEAFRV